MPSTVVGVDIGSSGVRAAEFRSSSRGPVLRKFATTPLPAGAVKSGVVIDGAAVTTALKTLWAEAKFSTKTIVFGTGSQGALVRQMDLDWMPPADFKKALRYQVDDALPMPVDEANLDYHLLEELDVPGAHPGETRRIARILLVAASREVVDSSVKAAAAAGLRVIRADLVPFALIRARKGTDAGATQSEALVDIGASTVTVVVHRGGQPLFVRIIPAMGGDAITSALQLRYTWSYDDAERTKVVVGLPPRDTAALEHPAQQVIAEQVAGLAREIKTTLNFFLESGTEHAGAQSGAQHSGADPDTSLARVVLSGGGSLLGRLPEALQDALGVPVEPLLLADALRTTRKLQLDEHQASSLAVAAGLCLGGAK
jgi:type IV pilus assembly protein PilM